MNHTLVELQRISIKIVDELIRENLDTLETSIVLSHIEFHVVQAVAKAASHEAVEQRIHSFAG